MARTKLTGFSRLLIFLLIFVPIAYVGASYFNGEDPIENIKGYLGMEETAPSAPVDNYQPTQDNAGNKPATFENVQDLRSEIVRLKRDLAISQEQLARCKTEGVE